MTMLLAHRQLGLAIDHENRQKDDFYATPPELTQALLRVEQFDGPIWEPACGQGHISKVLIAAGYDVISTDLNDWGYGKPRIDFLMECKPLAPNVMTNPPYKLLTPFLERAAALRFRKVAFLLRLNCLAGASRWEIYKRWPLARIWVFAERPQLRRFGYEGSIASGMIDLAWFVWDDTHISDHTDLRRLHFGRGAT